MYSMLSVRFEDMPEGESILLTEGGSPFLIHKGCEREYADNLWLWRGWLGDFAELPDQPRNVVAVYIYDVSEKRLLLGQ